MQTQLPDELDFKYTDGGQQHALLQKSSKLVDGAKMPLHTDMLNVSDRSIFQRWFDLEMVKVGKLGDNLWENLQMAKTWLDASKPHPQYISSGEDFDVRRFMDEKSAEIAFRDPPAPVESATLGVPPDVTVAKVAFLFIAEDLIQHEAVWDSFFANAAAGKFSIYIHRSNYDSNSVTPLSRWGAVEVPHIPSAWCAISGVEVGVVLHALADKANSQFVLVSGDSVPLKPFDYIYNHLVVYTGGTSKICYKDFAPETGIQWNPMYPMIFKHHQWVILSRDHAAKFVQNFGHAIGTVYDAISMIGHGCSDEATVGAAILWERIAAESAQSAITDKDLNQAGITQYCTTFVYWIESFDGTPLDITRTPMAPSDWSREAHPLYFGKDNAITANYLEMLVTQEGFMFGRKFLSGAVVDNGMRKIPLSEALPPLWGNVNRAVASKHRWSRLDATGAKLRYGSAAA